MPPSFRGRGRVWIPTLAGLGLATVLAWVAWLTLPALAPGFVVRWSPWLEPALRAVVHEPTLRNRLGMRLGNRGFRIIAKPSSWPKWTRGYRPFHDPAGPLLAATRHRDGAVRALALGELWDPQGFAVPDQPGGFTPFLRALGDPEAGVRTAAEALLARYDRPQELLEPLAALYTGDEDDALRAVLIRYLDRRYAQLEPSWEQRSGGQELADVLVLATRHPLPEVRRVALRRLVDRLDARAVPLVVEALAAGPIASGLDAAAGAWYLERVRDPQHALPVSALLDHPDPSVAAAAVIALTRMSSRDATPALIRALAGAAGTDRVIPLLQALAANGDARALTAVLPLLRAEDPAVRCMAAWTLGSMDDPRVAPLLLAALADEHWLVQRAAHAGLMARDLDAAQRAALEASGVGGALVADP